MNNPYHKFHIPVMGLAYTIDSPVKVARFGIASVISIVEDRLIEMMRKHYYSHTAQAYYPISTKEEDYRAKRITDYLNLVNTIVQAQVEKLKQSAFEAGSEIVKYFEMLPDGSNLKNLYRQMMKTEDQRKKEQLAAYLRAQIQPGSIDVNIMTKTDRDHYNKDGVLVEDGSDAVSALRGYAKSNLTHSSVIFSAGMNPRLYNYLEKCNAFDVTDDGEFKKKVVVKVSDYRSALIQGKYLAKKGIWVSEFRIESGLNCGGHAFATDGYLLGPILEEFKTKKQELAETMLAIYNQALKKKCNKTFRYPPLLKISVQGGVGTFEETQLLQHYFKIDSTGWGTPFLLVPEATTVDKETLDLLCRARKNDVYLSNNSPLGVRFYSLKGTTSAKEKQQRIDDGKPGSPCTEKHLEFNTEFTKEPICTASRKYQKLKIGQLQSLHREENDYQRKLKNITDKECLCIGLSNAAAKEYEQPFLKNLGAVTICPGPNIINFSQTVSLQKMIDHIYGRTNIITNGNRPHMFITELHLYTGFLQEALTECPDPDDKKKKYFSDFFKNLQEGICYYRSIANEIPDSDKFVLALGEAQEELNLLQQLVVKPVSLCDN